jgi:hypothetical protein
VIRPQPLIPVTDVEASSSDPDGYTVVLASPDGEAA